MVVGFVGVEYIMGYVLVVAPSCLTKSTYSLETGSCNFVCFYWALIVESEKCYARGDRDGKRLRLFLP